MNSTSKRWKNSNRPRTTDAWAAEGNPGWSFRDVLPYFIKLETNDVAGSDQLHGTAGPVTVTSIKHRHELIEAAIGAATALGVPRTMDFNGARQEGVGYYQLTTSNGLRMSAADDFTLSPCTGHATLWMDFARGLGVSAGGEG